jgi:hydrogenase maturation protease
LYLVRDSLPQSGGRAPLRVVCVGNAWRGDDAVGLEVAKLLRGTLPEEAELFEREGEPTALMDAWEGAEAIWIVDAVSSSARAGAVHRLDASDRELPGRLFGSSTHHFGLADAVEIARALGRLPRRTIVFGVEGASFAAGEKLTPDVAAAASEVADLVRREVVECTSRR